MEGQAHLCQLNPDPLATADEWLHFHECFWSKRLDALEEALKVKDAIAARQSREP